MMYLENKKVVKENNANKILQANTEKGITLIALIITIIVLGILAGVTLKIAIGNKGIVENSKTEVKDYERQAALEDIDLAISAWYLQKDADNAEDLETVLREELGEKFESIALENGIYKIKYDGYEFDVNADEVGTNMGS